MEICFQTERNLLHRPASSLYLRTISGKVYPLSAPLATTDSLPSTAETSQLSPTFGRGFIQMFEWDNLVAPQSVCFRMGSNFKGYIRCF